MKQDDSTADGFTAYVSFLAAEQGGREQPAINSRSYRPHLIVGDPCQRETITDNDNQSLEEHLGVRFDGDGGLLAPGPAQLVRLVALYSPQVNYDALVPAATFTIREGAHVVGFGVVAPPAIYADFNGAGISDRDPALAAIHLHRMGSLRDLSRLGIVLTQEMRLAIYMDSDSAQDIEASAQVYFDAASGFWMAEYDPAAIRDVPRHADWSGPAFPCVSCRADLAAVIQADGLALGQRCVACGCPIHRPILPPR